MEAFSFNTYRHSHRIITGRRIEQADKAADNQIVELPLLGTELIEQHGLFRWDYRMMVAYLTVVHNPFGNWQRLAQQRTSQSGVWTYSDAVQAFLKRSSHISGQITAVSPRISDQLMLLIQPLQYT
ncbi:hypothetical protein D3C73_1280690 [compost metagenome]